MQLNYPVPFIPERPVKPRDKGLTMMMDKGLSLRQVEDYIDSSAEYTDMVKLGFGTSLFTKNLSEKIKLYKEAGIIPYFGGTCFEVFAIRDMLDDYKKYLEKYDINTCEVSDGSLEIPHETKLEWIASMKKDFVVLSEVGSKQADKEIPSREWIDMMKKELDAGSWKIICEARESGNLGIYNSDGSANTELVDGICEEINIDDVIWEAPNKKQQVYFIKLLGSDVNLGNIATNEVFALESIRLGLRGDTFFDFMPK